MTSSLPFTPAVVVGDLLYCSGQIGLGPDGVVAGFGPQVRRSFANLEALLKENGSSLGDVFKATVFLANISDYDEMNTVYVECFGDTRPVGSAVAVDALPLGALFEIEVIARLG